MITWLLSNLTSIGVTLGALFAVIGGAYLKGRSAGKAATIQKQEKDDEAFLARKTVRDTGFDGQSDDELRSLLNDGRDERGHK